MKTRNSTRSIKHLISFELRSFALCTGFFVASVVGQYVNAQESSRPSIEEMTRPMKNPREIPLITIHMGPEFVSTWLFGSQGSPAIPAGFFDKDSDAWSGAVSCIGIPLDPNGLSPLSDLVVQHEAVEWVENPEKRYGPREIPKEFKLRCRMLKLREKGTEPVVVTYNNGTRSEKWDVEVTLAKDHPGGGMIEITRLNDDGNGGHADIELAVKVDFTFTRQGDSKKVVLTSGIEWLSETHHEFLRWADPSALKEYHIPETANGTFIPAAKMEGGKFEPLGKASCNARVQHSFTLAPSKESAHLKSLIESERAKPGFVPYIRQIPKR